jgi:hypothetical protein
VWSLNFSQGELLDPSQVMFVNSLEELDLVLKIDKSLQRIHKDELVVNKDKLKQILDYLLLEN